MKIISVFIIISIMISIGFLSGCNDIIGGEKPNCYVIKTNGFWSSQYNAFFCVVTIHNNGGKGNVQIGCDVTQDGQTFNYWSMSTVPGETDYTSGWIRCGDIKQFGGDVHYTGWVRNAE